MIEAPYPSDWRVLQAGVCRLLTEVGLIAEIEKKLITPRGEVEVDVYAVDKNSVDQIRYLVECKNWNSAIPQSVVHSFTTIMHETGGNIGFIVSRKGFQAGAKQYLQNTNIVGVTYSELQQRYLARWWEKYFVPKIGSAVDTLIEYVEPINSKRERLIQELPEHKRKEVHRLQEKYTLFGMTMAFFEFPIYSTRFNIPAPGSIDEFKLEIAERLGTEFAFSSEYFRDLANEITAKLQTVTNEFHDVFGKNIFA
ncbi:MAG: restriction endonuclease [Nitrosomonas sp.]|nr:restriction endonuclease [Nitrosomonas sp.]